MNNNNSMISVIVPVFNVEEYLEQCLESIINQTYRNLEIIIVDDGSTDNSASICDEYAFKDDRIQVIHQNNKGAANAKNMALGMATGEYLAFVDSDDYLETDAYEHMLKLLTEYQADVIQCSFRDIHEDHTRDRIMMDSFCELSMDEYLVRFVSDWTCSLLWDKLYKRHLFDGIRFKEGRVIDDEFFTYKGILNAEKIIHDPRIVYNYRRRSDGLMNSEKSHSQIIIDTIDYGDERRKIVGQKKRKLAKVFNHGFVDLVLYVYNKKCKNDEEKKRVSKHLGSILRSCKKTDFSIKDYYRLLKISSFR